MKDEKLKMVRVTMCIFEEEWKAIKGAVDECRRQEYDEILIKHAIHEKMEDFEVEDIGMSTYYPSEEWEMYCDEE